jgi:hypothetical protein
VLATFLVRCSRCGSSRTASESAARCWFPFLFLPDGVIVFFNCALVGAAMIGWTAATRRCATASTPPDRAALDPGYCRDHCHFGCCCSPQGRDNDSSCA